ncbi:hypothetical protein [Deinococcus ruber]|uniref:Uncharacterized protein n=1 Tax=Deinococcus ruber TaxID=1848197 RepID=A0A918F8I7_9DEIO|nr:hypothetical protein [Deinococcus ruber]GGR15660.1 hypothetical protein GCM10008957_30500 [Deinococcus ruber]
MARMNTWRDSLRTRPTHAFFSMVAAILLPWLTTSTLHSWQEGRNAAHLVTTCTNFVHGTPGWGLANNTLTIALDFAQSAAPNLAAAYTQATELLQTNIQSASPEMLRLHALPVYANRGPLGTDQRLAGPTLALTSTARHSDPGSSALFVDLPWRGGGFIALDVTGPCGTYHQQFSLFLSGNEQGVITIVTTAAGKEIARQYLSATH